MLDSSAIRLTATAPEGAPSARLYPLCALALQKIVRAITLETEGPAHLEEVSFEGGVDGHGSRARDRRLGVPDVPVAEQELAAQVTLLDDVIVRHRDQASLACTNIRPWNGIKSSGLNGRTNTTRCLKKGPKIQV